ncbi:hypothetical protein BDQ17DRAFT_1438535 [Cyathus striatus]|nr:hypothetical protein BDQ17DRAFT_1438535 [Cyathus striatus]
MAYRLRGLRELRLWSVIPSLSISLVASPTLVFDTFNKASAVYVLLASVKLVPSTSLENIIHAALPNGHIEQGSASSLLHSLHLHVPLSTSSAFCLLWPLS